MMQLPEYLEETFSVMGGLWGRGAQQGLYIIGILPPVLLVSC